MIGDVLNITKAVFVRCLLFSHGVLCIYRTNRENGGEVLFWLLSIPLCVLVIEGIVMSAIQQGREFKWASASFLLYLCSTVPAIWILEIGRISRTDSDGNVEELDITEGIITSNAFVGVLEQLTIYLMIIGRWILPRGERSQGERSPDKITSDDLSQLILTYISMALDITNLFALLEQKAVREDTGMTIAILLVWTVSLLQFTVILTATKNKGNQYFLATETWSIIFTLLLQDLPFLTIRLILMFNFMVLNYSIVAFAVKNTLLMVLLAYRLWVIYYETKKSKMVD